MKKALLVLVLVAMGCVDYAKAPNGVEADSQESTQVVPADECVESIDCPAGETCDQGECVAKVAKPEQDASVGEPDTETPAPKADTATGGVDTSVPPSPDTIQQGPDTVQPSPDTEQPSVDTVQPGPDTIAPKPDVEVPQTDTIQPDPDTIQPSPDVETPSPDVETPQVDTEQGGGEDAIAPSPDTVVLLPIPSTDTSADAEANEPDVAAPPVDASADGEGDIEGQPDVELAPPCVPVDEICGNAIDEDCDGEDVPCPPPVAKATITVEDAESTALSLQTDITPAGPYGWATIQDTSTPFGWELEIGESDSESELYRLNIFREPDGDWLCSVPGGGEPTCLVLPTLSVDGETIVVESYTARVIIPAGVAAVFEDPRYPDGNVANIGYCRGASHCEVNCDNGLDDDNDGLVDKADPHCN